MLFGAAASPESTPLGTSVANKSRVFPVRVTKPSPRATKRSMPRPTNPSSTFLPLVPSPVPKPLPLKRPPRRLPVSVLAKVGFQTLCVDAACSGNPGAMEYRGVFLAEGREIFHFGPVHGTNNIGEFLAIVHALALLDKQGTKMPIYSDSATAISWVRRKQCRTQLARTPRTEKLYEMIARAEAWLKAHRVTNPILKWETDQWGEIPADFGRK